MGYKDIVICKICNKEFKRSNRTHHKLTKIHQLYEQMNEKFRQIMFSEKEKNEINSTEFKERNIKKSLENLKDI